jgi:hypothetical protein
MGAVNKEIMHLPERRAEDDESTVGIADKGEQREVCSRAHFIKAAPLVGEG